jgi:hypothetical protein
MRIDKGKLTLQEHLRRANKKRWKKKGAKKAMAQSMIRYWSQFTADQRSAMLASRAVLREQNRQARLRLEPDSRDPKQALLKSPEQLRRLRTRG